MRRLKRLNKLLHDVDFNDDNFHRIAISNLRNPARRLERWWSKKYRTPQKGYEEHTEEELYIEMLEDYYEKNPKESLEFLKYLASDLESDDWEGDTTTEYESGMQDRIEKLLRPVDLSQYQSDKEVSEDDVMAEIDKAFPCRKTQKTMALGDDDEDIDDVYDGFMG